MGLFDGKKGIVMGVANDHSIAWAITECLHAEGAEMGFTHLPDKDPSMPRMERRVKKLVEPIGAKFLMPCNVQADTDLDRAHMAAKPLHPAHEGPRGKRRQQERHTQPGGVRCQKADAAHDRLVPRRHRQNGR